METRKNTNGLETFFENWWFPLLAIAVLLTWQVMEFFQNLCGIPWICFCAASFTLMICGAGLIGYAKFPVYRSGQYFTFGPKSMPNHLRKLYCWGWGVYLFGVLLSVCLLLSKPLP
ncbi:MAG TPA: hypothetical protein VGY56_02145 [Verrucomicrobiae bacterium]|nr:hypothetical protein [Verrucomicrobiae bacterium]